MSRNETCLLDVSKLILRLVLFERLLKIVCVVSLSLEMIKISSIYLA
jgi:hypothetical protein